MGNSCNCMPQKTGLDPGERGQTEEEKALEIEEEEEYDLEPATHFPTHDYATPLKENPLELNETIVECLTKLSELRPPKPEDCKEIRMSVSLQEYFLLEDGSVYQGYWYYGKPHVFGRFYYSNGNYYEGAVENGVPHGDSGRKIWVDGSHYDGEFSEGEMTGDGALEIVGKARFKGNFLKGKLNGEGTENWHNKCLYKGHFLEGKRDGYGKLEWIKKNGEEFYEGEFKDGKFDGKGKYKWQDGRIYEGEWSEGRMNGEGKFTWADGREYNGSYMNDVKNGPGTFIWPGGRSFRGEWVDGLQEGEGIFTDRFNVEHLVKYSRGQRIIEEKESIQNLSDIGFE